MTIRENDPMLEKTIRDYWHFYKVDMTESELNERIRRWIVINRLDDLQGLNEWTKLVNDIKGKGITDAEGRTRYVIGDSKTNP